MKFNLGLLKLELFCKGIKIDSSCDLSNDARPILRTRGGLGSGLELILEKNIYVNVPVVEHFVEKTPYLLLKKGNAYFITKDNITSHRVKLPGRPKFYDTLTSTGKPMSRIGLIQGTYLGIYPTRGCEFWQMTQPMNCKFCSLGLNLGCTEEYEKTAEEVLETVKAAQREEHITFVHFNTGYLFGEELEILEPYIKKVKEETGLLVGVQCPPSADLSKYNHLKAIGVDHVSFCLEIYNPDKFRHVCPGKHQYIGKERYLEATEYCVKVFGKGRISGEIIAGLESPLDTIRAIEYFAKIGAVATVCIFRPCLGTGLENLAPPDPEMLIPVFKRLYEVCIENGIPTGIAPNIRVSLVILPEEGRYFLEKLSIVFLISGIKLGILRLFYLVYFKIKILFKKK